MHIYLLDPSDVSAEQPADFSRSLSGGNDRELLAETFTSGSAAAFSSESTHGPLLQSFPCGLETDGTRTRDPFASSSAQIASSAPPPVDSISGTRTPNTVPVFDPSQEISTPRMILFWQTPSVFGQWTRANFTANRVPYFNAEQYFASEKARLFGDADALQGILRVSDPRLHK